jgi:hypothetical protein
MEADQRDALRSAFTLALRAAVETRPHPGCELEELGWEIREALAQGQAAGALAVEEMRQRAILAAGLEAALQTLRAEFDEV